MKNLLFIAVGLVVGIGGVLFFKGCRSGPSPETISATIRADSAQHVLDSTKAVDLPQIALLRADTARKARHIDSLQHDRDSLGKDLAIRGRQVQQLLDEGDAADSSNDCAAIRVNWDSLRAEVKAGLPIVMANDKISNEEITAFIAQGRVKDSLAMYWERLFHSADTANTLQKMAFTSLQKDFNKQQFAMKVWKPVAIGGMGLVVLDIIIHSLKK
jgi:hypothetical protein